MPRLIRHSSFVIRHWILILLLLTAACTAPTLAAPPATAAAPPAPAPPANRWEPAIQAFEAADRKNPPAPGGLVLIGSSSFTKWTTVDKDLAGLPIIRRGFGGSGLGDAVTYAPRIVLPYKPKAIIVYSGGNDLAAKKTAQYVADQFQRFVELVHQDLPDTRIYFFAIKPTLARTALDEKEKEANRLVQDYIKTQPNLGYIDINSQLLTPDGKPDPKFLIADKLHPSPAAYQLMAAAIRQALAQDHLFPAKPTDH